MTLPTVFKEHASPMMSNAPYPSFRLRIPSTLSVILPENVRTLPDRNPEPTRAFELRVAEFLPRSARDPRRLPHHYAAMLLREDPRISQLLRSMRMMNRVGWCAIDLAGDRQSAILSPDGYGFQIATRFPLHRDDLFAAPCVILIDDKTRGVGPLFLTDEAAAADTDIGKGDEESMVVRVLDAEIDHLIKNIPEPLSARDLLNGG